MSERPDWDEYFLGLVQAVSQRATCDRGRSGCVVVREKQILCTGYVGAPPHFPHCDEVGHSFMQVVEDDGSLRMHCIRTIHAEQNAIVQAARRGVALGESTFYCSMEPCRTCAQLIVSVGALRVVALKRYHAGQPTRDIFRTAGVDLLVVQDEQAEYPDQQLSSDENPARNSEHGADALNEFADIVENDAKRGFLMQALQSNECPQCGKQLTSRERYGSGQLSDGIFCSLRCYGDFHKNQLRR